MPQHSAGLVLYRRGARGLELLLVHMGGPFWRARDAGAWSIPKGLIEPGEDAAGAARREFTEETGFAAPEVLMPLGAFRQSAAKTVTAFAGEGDADPAALRSNTFVLEWPPRSGRMATFPEADRAAWFTPGDATRKLVTGQRPIVQALLQRAG